MAGYGERQEDKALTAAGFSSFCTLHSAPCTYLAPLLHRPLELAAAGVARDFGDDLDIDVEQVGQPFRLDRLVDQGADALGRDDLAGLRGDADHEAVGPVCRT